MYPPPKEKLVSSTNNKSRKTTQRVCDPRERETGKLNKGTHNMAGNEVEDLASLEAKVVNEGAVVEMTRRRYSQNKIYVSNILAARARFFVQQLLAAS